MYSKHTRGTYTILDRRDLAMDGEQRVAFDDLAFQPLLPAPEGGGYFGTKKACEPLHIQYSYDDRSIVVMNGLYQDFKRLKASAKIYNLDMTEKFSAQTNVDVGADGVVRAFALPQTV